MSSWWALPSHGSALSRVSPSPPPVASQVNVTLLDINDNHPTWKDAPYYINLVEMTPPDSDVTTVSGGGKPSCQAALPRVPPIPP